MNEWPMNFSQEVKRVTLVGKKKLDTKLIVFHGHFLFCHGQIFRNCHGHFSFVTGTFLAILSRATRHFSRAKFGVFCHGHFSKVTGTFSKNVTGKPKSFTGKKKTLLCSTGILKLTLVFVWRVCTRGDLISGFKFATGAFYPLKPQVLNNTNLGKSWVFCKYHEFIGN